MQDKPVFLLDANVFMQAARQYYAFDVAPGFWDGLIHHATQGDLLSIDKVKHELMRGNDALADWARDDFSNAFVTTARDDVAALYKEVMECVAGNVRYFDAVKAEFADGADGWLVAYARAEKTTLLVTQEQLRPDIKRRVPITNVCQYFKMEWIDTFEMLRRLGVSLGWTPGRR